MDITNTILDYRDLEMKEKLAVTPREEIEKLYEMWLNSWLEVDYIDDEELEYVGDHLALAKIERMDEFIHNWLWQVSNPSNDRIVIATPSLIGYWRVTRNGVIYLPAIEQLLTLADRVTIEKGTSLPWIIIALFTARISDLLDQALKDRIAQTIIEKCQQLEAANLVSTMTNLYLKVLQKT